MSAVKNKERKRKQRRTTTRAHSNGGGMATLEEDPSVNCENQENVNPPKNDPVFERAETAIRKTVAWMTKINASPGVNQWFTKTIEKQSNEPENLMDPERKAKMRNGENGFIEATRVALKELTDPTKDFINANHINIPHWNRTYICTQHPTEATFEDFWRMVFYENVENIIAIFAPEEKLPYYFPKEVGAFLYHGIFLVNCRKVIPPTQRFTPIRYLIEVLPEGCSNSHTVTILHYVNWPKDKFPESPRAILKTLVRIKVTDKDAPIVIHSAHGTDRSGCVIFVDSTTDLMFRNCVVDVPAHVKKLRTLRAGIISKPQTFVFGMCAMLEYVRNRLKKRKNDLKHDLLAETEGLLERLEKEYIDFTVKEEDKKKTETVDVNEN